MGQLLDLQRRQFTAAGADAALVAPAAHPSETSPAEASPAEAAAWTALARVLLNLDEFVTRE